MLFDFSLKQGPLNIDHNSIGFLWFWHLRNNIFYSHWVVVDLGLQTYCVLTLDAVDVPEWLIKFSRKGEIFIIISNERVDFKV